MRFLNSVKALYAAVGFLFLTFIGGSYVDMKSETMHTQQMEITSGLERMVRFNQELTNMLLIAVLDQSMLRAASYDTVGNELAETMRTVVELTKTQNSAQEIFLLSQSSGERHAFEQNVINLIRASKWSDARAVMFGDEYVLARKTNEIDSETAVGAVLGELSAAAHRLKVIRTAALGTRIGALLLLLWVGVMFSRRTTADLAEQVRLRKEISVANEELERRVRERTADLEDRSRQLARENEERLKSEARTSLILNSAGEGIFGVTKEERVTFFNIAAERLLGYSSDEVIGKEMHNLIHHSRADGGCYPREDCPMFQACSRGEEKHISDEVLWRKDGAMFPSEYSVMPIFDDKGMVDGAVVVFHDITERKNNERELKHRMDELVVAKKEADLATKAKSDFLANMSHEIRTPMNAIIGMSHLALKTDLTPKQHDYVNKIDVAAKSLLGIINDILDFSKIEAGKLAMESLEFDLAKTIENVANMITVKAQDKENLEVLYRLDPRLPPFLVGDPLRLSQILINLGNNAVKFTESGEIVLNVELVEPGADTVFLRFSVKDTGVGLTDAQRARLFQPFSQADASTTRKYGGTGLGLTISQRLVGMMGGEIWVESEYGSGSTFLFTAKLGLGQGLQPNTAAEAGELSGKRCLVIDDSKMARQVLEEMLISMNFQVDLASSGQAGLELIERHAREKPYELVFTDWKMPGMDGMETSRRIKEMSGLAVTPKIILVTSHARDEAGEVATQAGLDYILVKPVSASSLFNAISNAFGLAKSEKLVRRPKDNEANLARTIRGANILLVEDNEINQQVALEILEQAGLKVTIAENGLKGVEAIQTQSFDLVLMDIQMPVMDGYAATQKIRGDLKFKDLPIIAMSASAMVQDREMALSVGMNDHVGKPIDTQELFATLLRYIKTRVQAPDDPAGGPESPAPAPSTSTDEPAIPDLPNVDTTTGLKRVGGNKKLYHKLLVKFHNEYRESTAQIRQAFEASDRELALRLAHTVKGVAGNIGAQKLFEAGAGLEGAIKNGANEISDFLDIFDQNLREVLDSLAVLASPQAEVRSGPGAEAVPPAVLKAFIEKLTPVILKRSPKQIKELLAESTSIVWPREYQAEMSQMEKLVGKYKYKEAGELLATLGQRLETIATD